MSNEVFQQNLDDKKSPRPGGPYIIQMLFKEPVPMPDKEKMTAVMEQHIGAVECFCHDTIKAENISIPKKRSKRYASASTPCVSVRSQNTSTDTPTSRTMHSSYSA